MEMEREVGPSSFIRQSKTSTPLPNIFSFFKGSSSEKQLSRNLLPDHPAAHELDFINDEFMTLRLITPNHSGFLWMKRVSQRKWNKIPDFFQIKSTALLQFRTKKKLLKRPRYYLHRIVDLKQCHVQRYDEDEPLISLTQIRNEQEEQALLRAPNHDVFLLWLRSLTRNCTSISINSFDPIAKIGSGEWGNVFVARKGSAIMAVKEIRILPSSNIQHFIQERIVLSSISEFPFVVSLFYAFRQGNFIYLAMNFAPGGDLFTKMQKNRPTKGEAKLYAAELLLAMEHLHKYNVVYRDLKPENVLIGADGHIMLADMGLAKVLKHDEYAITFCGTESYLAPEIISRQPYRMSVDFWQFGCMVFELYCGRSPFWKPRHLRHDLHDTILRGTYRMPESLPSSAKEIIADLLRVNPLQRAGCAKHGWDSIKSYGYFRSVKFEQITSNVSKKPPTMDQNSLRFYLGNFETCFTTEDPVWGSDKFKPPERLLFQNELLAFDFRRDDELATFDNI